MKEKIKTGDKVVRLDLEAPFIYTIQKIEPDYMVIVRDKGRKRAFTLVTSSEVRLATKQEIYQGYPNG